MKILIDIGHPAHVHLFKNFASIMQKKGHKVIFTTRHKECEIHLLYNYGFKYYSFGRKYKGKLGKACGLIKFDFLMLLISLKHRPDLYLSHGSMYAAQVAWLLHKPHISLEDTGNMEQVMLYKPFTKAILTSTAFHKDFGEKQIKYAGYHELAYLHPNYFTPDANVYNLLGITNSQKYVLIRLVSWNASHDAGQSGLTIEYINNLIFEVSKVAKIYISAEGNLPAEFEKFRTTIPAEEMHNVLCFASLFVGEGATMASECAMLGTPAIYVNTIEAGTIDDQENYGLIYHFRNSDGVIEKAKELLANPIIKEEFFSKKQKMLADKIDVTAFMVWFVENYPESFRIMKENPDYQYKFK